MPIIQFKDCAVDGDLAQALSDMQQQIGETTQSILDEIQALPVDLTLIPQGHDIMDQMVLLSPNPLPRATVANNTGIPQSDPTQTDDEYRLEQLGLIMIRGVLYLADKSGNIEGYRRLYFALGADLTLFLSVVESGAAFAVVQTRLQVKPLPSQGSAWTLLAAQTLFNNPAIEAVYVGGDGQSYVVVPEFLALNQAKDQVSRINSIPEEEIFTQVFWFTQISQTPQTVGQLTRMGLSSDELGACLLGERYITFASSTVQGYSTAAGIATAKAVAQLNLLSSRFARVDAASKASLVQEANASIAEARLQWLAYQEGVREWTTLLVRPADITDFLNKNPQADLPYLFTQRQTVTGINFQATASDLISSLNQATNISAGSSTVSSLIVNSQATTIDPTVDQANLAWVQNTCASNQIAGRQVSYEQVITSGLCLNSTLSNPPTATSVTLTSATPVAGYASYDSPASLVSRQMNYNISLNTDGILNELSKLADDALLPVKLFLRALIALLTTIKAAIDSVFKSLNALVAPLVAQIEGFMSRFMAFHGTANLNSSVLKCALGLDIALSLPLLDDLAAFLNSLKAKLNNILASIAKVIADILTKLLCIPINFINSFLKQAQSMLPAFCQLNKASLPSDVEALIQQLLNMFQMQSDNFTSFSRDFLRVTAGIKSAPLKLGQFMGSLVCDNPATSSLLSSMTLTLSAGANPLNAASGILPSTSNLPTTGAGAAKVLGL